MWPVCPVGHQSRRCNTDDHGDPPHPRKPSSVIAKKARTARVALDQTEGTTTRRAHGNRPLDTRAEAAELRLTPWDRARSGKFAERARCPLDRPVGASKET